MVWGRYGNRVVPFFSQTLRYISTVCAPHHSHSRYSPGTTCSHYRGCRNYGLYLCWWCRSSTQYQSITMSKDHREGLLQFWQHWLSHRRKCWSNWVRLHRCDYRQKTSWRCQKSTHLWIRFFYAALISGIDSHRPNPRSHQFFWVLRCRTDDRCCQWSRCSCRWAWAAKCTWSVAGSVDRLIQKLWRRRIECRAVRFFCCGIDARIGFSWWGVGRLPAPKRNRYRLLSAKRCIGCQRIRGWDLRVDFRWWWRI